MIKTIEQEIQQTKFKSPHQKAVINLIYTANWLQSRQHAIFKPFGITGQQFNILRVLRGQFPKSISATELKSRMLDQNSDVSRLLDRLAGKKLAVKRTCPNDKRASDVFITEEGNSLLKEIAKRQKEIDTVLSLTPAEAEQLSDLLDRCRQ